jgi:hypothetical protein
LRVPDRREMRNAKQIHLLALSFSGGVSRAETS